MPILCLVFLSLKCNIFLTKMLLFLYFEVKKNCVFRCVRFICRIWRMYISYIKTVLQKQNKAHCSLHLHNWIVRYSNWTTVAHYLVMVLVFPWGHWLPKSLTMYQKSPSLYAPHQKRDSDTWVGNHHTH